MAMTESEVRELVLSFPQTEEGSSYGKPSFKAFGKFFTRIRAEDASLVLTGVDYAWREMLMEAEPETFHLTPHYQNYPAVLARLACVDPGTVKVMLEKRWREMAPKKLLREMDAAAKASA